MMIIDNDDDNNNNNDNDNDDNDDNDDDDDKKVNCHILIFPFNSIQLTHHNHLQFCRITSFSILRIYHHCKFALLLHYTHDCITLVILDKRESRRKGRGNGERRMRL